MVGSRFCILTIEFVRQIVNFVLAIWLGYFHEMRLKRIRDVLFGRNAVYNSMQIGLISVVRLLPCFPKFRGIF